MTELDAMSCALVTRDLGGGRMVAGQQLNLAVGLELLVEVGSEVEQGITYAFCSRCNVNYFS